MQDPDQPVKFAPAAGVAVSATAVLCGNFAEQLLPHPMDVWNAPWGVPLTVPLPLRPIDSVKTGTNVAVVRFGDPLSQ